jgi:cytochrome o ubiquinol oxidase subunit 2
MKRWWYVGLPVLAFAAVGVVAYLAYLHGARIAVLEPAGPVAADERGVITATLALSSVIVVPVFFILFYFAWKYRAESPRAHLHSEPDWDHVHPSAEFAWWLVPSAIVAVICVILWESAHALDPYKLLPSRVPPVEVEVVALDWKWLFIYPALDIASVNRLELPAGRPVHLALTADAPMNALWIPSLAGQIMIMPGMTTQLNLLASTTGDYAGFSSNISGRGFSGMAFTARVVSAADFAAWAARVRAASSTPLTRAAYRALAAPSEDVAPRTYAPVDPHLYTDIVNAYMPTMMPTAASTAPAL